MEGFMKKIVFKQVAISTQDAKAKEIKETKDFINYTQKQLELYNNPPYSARVKARISMLKAELKKAQKCLVQLES